VQFLGIFWERQRLDGIRRRLADGASVVKKIPRLKWIPKSAIFCGMVTVKQIESALEWLSLLKYEPRIANR
jgi:hypothetical protein